MINNDTAKSTYTVTDGVTEYPIVAQYTMNPDGTPNLYVWCGDNTQLEYGTGYTLSGDGLSVVLLSAIEAGTVLNIALDEPFIQDSDYDVGRIDPEQIESDFDKAVLRDLELRDYIIDTATRLATEEQARADADTALQNAVNAKQDTIIDLATIRSGAAAGATAVQPGDLATVATTGSYNDLSNKPTLGTAAAANATDFATAAQGAKADTAVQPGSLATVATTGSYNDLSNKPTIPIPGAAIITIKQGGVTKGSFNVNQSGDQEIELDQGGGGDVQSVNGKTGVVVLTAADVGAATAAQGAKADTAVQPGSLATVATTGSYNDLSNKPTIPAAQVNSDWSANSGVAQILNKPTLGTAAAANTTDFATAAQGAKADTAAQPADLAGYVEKTGDTMTGVLDFDVATAALYSSVPMLRLKATYDQSSVPGTIGVYPSGNMAMDKSLYIQGSLYLLGSAREICSASAPAHRMYVEEICGDDTGRVINVPATAGTMAVIGVNTTATLAAADWSSNTQTVSITGITAGGVVFVNPTPANQSAYTDAGILCTAQAAGSLTFTCDTVPSVDITVTVVML